MRYPAAETAEKHEKILGAASRLFRERGFSGVSVSEIMKATGLTHGPFYNHFASKEALMAECLAHASGESLAGLDAAAATPGGMAAYADAYLSPDHRDMPAEGCLLAALASEAAQTESVKATLSTHVQAMVQRYVKYVPWRSKQAARAESIRTLASMVGAVVLARAVDDMALSDEILRDVLSGLKRDALAHQSPSPAR